MERNYIIKVIPIQPLPPNSPDYFLYFYNEKIKVGSLVKIDFQKKEQIGYVLDLEQVRDLKYFIKNLDYQIKPIKKVLTENTPLTEYQKKLAFKLSRRYYLSLSHAFYLFLNFYKNFNFNFSLPDKIINKKENFSLIVKNEFPFELIKNKKTLIICPTLADSEIWYSKLKNNIENLIYLKDLKNIPRYLNDILSNEKNVFIGNKKIIFLPWVNIEVIVVIKEGSLFYREFFKIPKINYLEIIEDYAKLFKCKLVYVDNFYSLNIYLNQKNISLPQLDFSTFKDFSSLIRLINPKTTNKIFILQKSLGRKLICLNCYYQFECSHCGSYLTIFEDKLFCYQCHKDYPLINICPNCQKNDLSIKSIGKQWLRNFLINKGFQVYEINQKRDLKKINKKIENGCIILGDWHILHLPTANSFFINFDIGFFSENIFLKEKYIRLAHCLKETSKNLFFHSRLNTQLLEKIRAGLIIKDIIEERAINKLPPFYYQIKIVSRLSNLQELNRRLINLKEELKKRILFEKEEIEITGPFLERIFKIKKRYQMYLLIKSKNYLNLKKLLENLKYFEEIKFDDYDF